MDLVQSLSQLAGDGEKMIQRNPGLDSTQIIEGYSLEKVLGEKA